MDVLFLSVNDWANVGRLFQEACNRVGLAARSYAHVRHGFNYELENSYYESKEDARRISKQAKITVFMHSVPAFIPVKKPVGAIWGVFHGGTQYRTYPDKYNKMWNAVSDFTLIQTAELLGLGAKNEKWVFPPVDTRSIVPVYTPLDKPKLFVSHYPRNPELKGTEAVSKVLAKFVKAGKFIHNIQTGTVSHRENLRRMAACDIYIEKMAPVCPEWGITTLEAAALGKVVITHHQSRSLYEKEFGYRPPLVRANTEHELHAALESLFAAKRETIFNIQKSSRKWVDACHSLEAVGHRLSRIFYEASGGKVGHK